MSRLKGYAVAGLHILNTKPAGLAKYGRVLPLLLVGPVLLSVSLTSLVSASGSSIPVPPRKPVTAELSQNASKIIPVAYAPSGKKAEDSYRSPMSGQQMDYYRDIFRLQSIGQMEQADAIIAKLKDTSLIGHVLAQRYLHPSYKASFDELKKWLSAYADHPQADRIAKLAGARIPSGHKGGLTKASYSAASIEELEEPGMGAKAYTPKLKRNPSQNAQAADMIRSVRRDIQQYEPSAALNAFNQNPVTAYLDDVEKDRIRAMVASGYLFAGKTAEAEKLAAAALKSKDKAPLAGWVHGLAKYRTGQYSKAAKSFEIAAESEYASGWMQAASAYWAARSHEKAGHSRRMNKWLEIAAEYPRTFYGLLALQALGEKPDLDWGAPSLSSSQEKEILKTDAGQRAERLIAAGEIVQAEAELRSLYVKGDHKRKTALMAYAYDRNLPSLAMKLAHAVATKEDDTNVAALYPPMPWSPNQGYRIDRALLHAIARQESRFNATAENKGSGATGLMQLMPATAKHVAKEEVAKTALKDPEISLDLGQKYVEELLNNELIGQDLLSLAMAYNAGPGTLSKWKAERADIDDPLLFIETIPFAETRAFVERVMANYWMYRMRFDQPNDSMIALAEGRWARYAAFDKGALKFAAAE